MQTNQFRRDVGSLRAQMQIGPNDKFADAYPCEFAQDFLSVDFAHLAASGRTFGIFDVDNCLMLRGATAVSDLVAEFIKRLLVNILDDICLVSNVGIKTPARHRRIRNLAQQLGIPGHYVCAYWPWIKPDPWPFRRAMELMGSAPFNTFIIGDQLFSDIRGGNRLKIYTLHVPPLGSDHWMTAHKRKKERKAFKLWRQFEELPAWLTTP